MYKHSIDYGLIVYTIIFVFFGIMFMINTGIKENIYLVISFSGLILLLKKIFNLKKSIYILHILITIFFIYNLTILIIFQKSYVMNIYKPNYDTEEKGQAVLLVYKGEGEMYDLKIQINNIKINGNYWEKYTLPFILYRNKKYYENIGKSYYKKNTVKVKEMLENEISDDFKVYIGYLNDTKYVEESLIDIVNEGYHNIIVVPVFLTDSREVSILKQRIDKMKLYNLNIQVRYTETLWKSTIAEISYLNKIIKQIDLQNVLDVGVILVGNDNKYKGNESTVNALKQDLMFRQGIQKYLVEKIGLQEYKVKLGWIHSLETHYIEAIQELLEQGVGKIICIYINPSTTNIENVMIARKIHKSVQIPEAVSIKVIDGFLKDLNFVLILKKSIEFVNLQSW